MWRDHLALLFVDLIRLNAVINKFTKYDGLRLRRLSGGALLDDDTSVSSAESHVLVPQAPAILAGWLQVNRHTSPSGIRKIPRIGAPSSSNIGLMAPSKSPHKPKWCPQNPTHWCPKFQYSPKCHPGVPYFVFFLYVFLFRLFPYGLA